MAQRYERLLNGKIWRYYETTTGETIRAHAPVYFQDFFPGADCVIPAAGATESGVKWVKEVSGSGAAVAKPGTTVGKNGQVLLTAPSTTNAGYAMLHMDDTCEFCVGTGTTYVTDSPTGLQMEFWMALQCDTATDLTWFCGLISAVNGNEGSAYGTCTTLVGFSGSASLVLKCESDDNTIDTPPTSTGTTLVTKKWHHYRIDLTNPADVKFYFDGARVCTGTTFDVSKIASGGVLQPIFDVAKSTTSATIKMAVQGIRIWSDRPNIDMP